MSIAEKTAEESPVIAEGPRKRHPLRRDGDVMLTGQAEYLDDVHLPDILHATVVRSPHAHARIVNIDVSEAESADGVRAVLTPSVAADMIVNPLPHFYDAVNVGGRQVDVPMLTGDVARYVGDPIVAIAADTLAQAEAAAKLVRIEYDIREAIVDVERALSVDAPRIFEDWDDNVLARLQFAEGDAAAAIDASPRSLSGKLAIQRYQTSPLETRGYLASWQRKGITLWGSTQNPHPVRTYLAHVFGLGEDRIRVIATRIGGGFGHKVNCFQEEYIVCALSKLTGAPVKWLETRAECMLVGGREYYHDFNVGFDESGRILGFRDEILANIGSVSSWGGWPMIFPASMTFPGPYKVPNCDIQIAAVVTNKAPWSGARGYGKESATLMMERVVDLIAADLGMDPAEVRARNFVQPDEFPFWTAAKRLDSGNYPGALDMVLELANYPELRRKQQQARDSGLMLGVGIGFELTPEGGDYAGSLARGFETSTVRVSPSGTVTVLTGVTSLGTGNETTIACMVGDVLGVDPDAVNVLQGDTDSVPYGFGAFSSRAVITGGSAAISAAKEVRGKMAGAAAAVLQCDVGDLVFVDGAVRSLGDPTSALSFSELATLIYKRAGVTPGVEATLLEATAVDKPNNIHGVPDEKGRFSPYPSYPYSVHLAVVAVDSETGVSTVTDYFAVDDCGKVLSPIFVEGQLNGGIAMGIGAALYENLPYESDGQPQAISFKHYLLPRATDMPPIRTDYQETPSPFTPLGAKGAGESGLGGALAAVANAVNDAIAPLGVSIDTMPLDPPTVLEAIHAGRSKRASAPTTQGVLS